MESFGRVLRLSRVWRLPTTVVVVMMSEEVRVKAVMTLECLEAVVVLKLSVAAPGAPRLAMMSEVLGLVLGLRAGCRPGRSC